LFTLTNIQHSPSLPSEGDVHPQAWQGRLHRSLDEVVIEDQFPWSRAGGRSRYSFDQSRLDYPARHLVMWEMDQFPDLRDHFVQRFTEYQGLQDEQIQARVFQQHLTPCDDVISRCARFQEAHFVPGKMVGVHVRKTQECDANRPNPEVQRFVSETRRLMKSDRERRLFLACDNRAVIEIFQAAFGSERVRVFPKWMPAAGMHMHMNRECPDQLQNVRDAIADAMLLGRCDWLISSRSSAFSWLGRMFSAASENRRATLSPTLPWNWRFRSFVRSCLSSSVVGLLKRQ